MRKCKKASVTLTPLLLTDRMLSVTMGTRVVCQTLSSWPGQSYSVVGGQRKGERVEQKWRRIY